MPGSLCVWCIARQTGSKEQKRKRKSSIEISMLVLNMGNFEKHFRRTGSLSLQEWLTHKNPSYDREKVLKVSCSPINWKKRVRVERQRAPNEFLKAGFQFFCYFFFSLWLVGKSSLVPKMYKEVQGSVSVSWIMQWSQRRRRGGRK